MSALFHLAAAAGGWRAGDRGLVDNGGEEVATSSTSAWHISNIDEIDGLNGAVPVSRMESEGPVVGLAVRIVESVLGARSLALVGWRH